jgi:hypothetical protein
LQATGEIRDRIEALARTNPPQAPDAPILETGAHEFKSSRDPSMMYRVTFMLERLEEFHRQSGIRTRFPS